ncbi:MAG: TonB-dependent receptor plug domain-containing protein, partial [Acidobacteria bacterium]|nr:TonB-dependent receptor plug domain-containing protein [Acidobacteriota bacterium]
MAALSDANGRFSIDVSAARPSTLRVSAAGFATIDVRVPPGDAGLLRIVIAPAPLDEAVTVTASRGADRLATAPTTTVLSGAALVSSGAGAIDDALRQTPGFSLFRRSTSRVANPTTQGVTLRGVSGSGASRSSVLVDGASLNDPFGSWVYWNRVPLASIDRIEVMRGAGGDLYGAEALGGVVQIVTADATRASGVRAVADYGTQDSARLSGLAAAGARGWSLSATAEW